MYCSKCGKQLNDDANFCYNCGYPLKSSIPEVREATATENNADFMSSQISASNENQQRQETLLMHYFISTTHRHTGAIRVDS